MAMMAGVVLTALLVGLVEPRPLVVDSSQAAAVKPIDREDADKLTALMRASARGDLQSVKALLAKGASPDAQSSERRLTAIMFAAYFGHAEIVSALLESGAKPDLADASGAGPIDWAMVGGHDALTKVFSGRGASLNPFLNVATLPLSLMDQAAEKPK
jgi:ankyrin repeat protein